MKVHTLFMVILSLILVFGLSQGCDKGKGMEIGIPTEPTSTSAALDFPTYENPREIPMTFPRPAVISVKAWVEPRNYIGQCPATVTFYGSITVNGPMTVTYRWEHSPGTGVIETITFAGAGSAIVTKEYTSDRDDFLELVILTPNTMYNGEHLIANADFTVRCVNANITRPAIPIPIK